MKYKTKEWEFDAFEWHPNGDKPDWWLNMLKTGQAFEYAELKGKPPYASFSDKRSKHKAFVGDSITRDVFGRVDVYSSRNFAQRATLANRTN